MTELISLSYFHGTVDLRECRELLPDVGDFLVRLPGHLMKKSKETVFSVLTLAVVPAEAVSDPKSFPKDASFKAECSVRLKSVSICGTDGSFSLQGTSETFPTIQALCDSWVESGRVLPSGGKLVRGVPRKPWELFLSDIELPEQESVLGKGAYGKVIKARLLRKEGEPKEVAVKVSTVESGVEEMFTEARAMRHLTHPNIIGLEGVVVEKLPVMLVIELCDGTSLQNALRKKAVSDTMRFPIVCGIMYAALYMHGNGFIHRDIAARNVMVSADCRNVKLIDFGLVKHSLQFHMTAFEKIPVRWLAPEVLERTVFSTKSDVWAFGVTVWEVYHDGAEPYSNNPKHAVKNPEVKKSLVRRKGPSEFIDLRITENLAHLPKLFEPIFLRIMSTRLRTRPEFGQIASEVERQVYPTLPQPVLEECQRHMEKRPPYNSKMVGPTTSELSNSKNSTAKAASTPSLPSPNSKPSIPPAPPTARRHVNVKTVTRRRRTGVKKPPQAAESSDDKNEPKKKGANVTQRRKTKK